MCKGEVASSLFVEASVRLVQVIWGYGERRIYFARGVGFFENHDLIMYFGARCGAVD